MTDAHFLFESWSENDRKFRNLHKVRRDKISQVVAGLAGSA